MNYSSQLVPYPLTDSNGQTTHYYVDNKLSSYSQAFEMDSWAAVSANPSVQEALYVVSGLAYIELPYMQLIWSQYQVPTVYIGFENGLFYYTPRVYPTNEIPPIDET